MTRKNLASAEITPGIIDEWKAEFGDVYTITVSDATDKFDPLMVPKDDDETIDGVTAYIRKPSDKELSFAMSKLPAVLEAGKVIVKNCFIGGDERVRTEPALLNAAALQCVELIEIRRARLKKA